MPLTTLDPQQLRYEGQSLAITVLGGIRLEGLDRLRVTLKIESIEPENINQTIRHNLDLYNDNQVERLMRKICSRMMIGTGEAHEALSDLTSKLEAYRLEMLASGHESRQSPKLLTKEEQQAAIDYLKQKHLLKRTGEDIGRSGVVGEEKSRLLMYLIFSSRKRDNPLHIVSLGSSGIGKSHLQEKVGALIPEEDKLEITTLSENAFYYFQGDELRNKLILIEDLDGAESSLYPIRELQSKKRITKTLTRKNHQGETKTIHLRVEGPVCVAGCTTRESLYEDNANRSFLIYIDESKAQDERVMDYQRKLSAGKINTEAEAEIRAALQNVQRLLKPIRVINPYAEKLSIPEAVFKPRRTNGHYLAFIEAVTFYHQYQREEQHDEETGEAYIETTLEDIEAANELMKDVLLRKSDELSSACRSFLERLKGWLRQEKRNQFKVHEVRGAFRMSHSKLKRYMLQLQHGGYVFKGEGDQKNGYLYHVDDLEEYAELKQRVESALDKALARLKAPKPRSSSKQFTSSSSLK